MSDSTITAGFVRTYKTNVELLLQQKGSKLRTAVTEDTYVGESAMAVEQVGSVEPVVRTTRHADTPLIETPHDSRWVFPTDYEWADLIANIDKVRRLTDPQSAYAQNGAFALGRAQDTEIITALLGDAKTGQNGGTTTSFDTSNQQVAASVGGAASGLNLQKLREGKKILMANEVDLDNDMIFMAITAEQHDNLLAETQAVSTDYNIGANGRPVLVDGRITSFMGVNFIHTELLTTESTGNNDRRCPMWAKSGMHLGIWNDITTRIEERNDKSFETQVYVKGTFGATRLEEKKVVEILCDET